MTWDQREILHISPSLQTQTKDAHCCVRTRAKFCVDNLATLLGYT